MLFAGMHQTEQYETGSIIRTKSLWQWYININIMFLDFICHPVFI
jgi:hypothetical protein